MSECDSCAHLCGLIVGGVEAFDGDLSEDVGLQRLLSQVTVVNDGWGKKRQLSFYLFCNLYITSTGGS